MKLPYCAALKLQSRAKHSVKERECVLYCLYASCEICTASKVKEKKKKSNGAGGVETADENRTLDAPPLMDCPGIGDDRNPNTAQRILSLFVEVSDLSEKAV